MAKSLKKLLVANKEGKRDYALMVNYVRELNKVAKPSLKISNEYIKSNPDISDEEKALFLMEAVTESDSKLYDQLIALKDVAIKASSKEAFEAKINEVSMVTVSKAVEYDYRDLVDEAILQYAKANVGNQKKFEFEANLEYCKLAGDYNEWKECSQKYLKKFGKKDIDLYKATLTAIDKNFKHVKESSDYAINLFEDLIKKEDTSENYMAFIKKLTNIKKTDKAIKVTKEAIKKAQKREEDVTEFERALDYLNSI